MWGIFKVSVFWLRNIQAGVIQGEEYSMWSIFKVGLFLLRTI